MEHFLKLMAAERQYQADKFANGDVYELTLVDQTENDPFKFAAYISKYAVQWFVGGFVRQWDQELLWSVQRSMVKVATLAYACYMWAERRAAKL